MEMPAPQSNFPRPPLAYGVFGGSGGPDPGLMTPPTPGSGSPAFTSPTGGDSLAQMLMSLMSSMNFFGGAPSALSGGMRPPWQSGG